MALLEWPDNIDISDDPPSECVPKLKARIPVQDWETMHDLHALPNNWENMEYQEFLAERRLLMAQIIRRGFETLRH
jgi:hypothetical protein